MEPIRKLRGYKPSRFMAADSYYSRKQADTAVAFIEQLKHFHGEWRGQRFELMDWQEQIVRDLFGILRKSDNSRQFKAAYIELPKKNGKSELAAAIALLLTCADWEHGGEIYSCATDRNQAKIVFNVALRMVQQNSFLRKMCTYTAATNTVTFRPLGSTYKVVSADYGNKDGFNAHGVIFDELHAQKTADLFEVMTSSSGLTRRQPLTFIITTAGYNRESICWRMHEAAMDVLEGRKADESLYPVIFSAAPEDDWQDEAVWRRVNPSYGVTIRPENFRNEYQKALRNPVEENRFRRLNLNQWLTQLARWMPMDLYDKCGGEIAEPLLAGRPCYGGLDLSDSKDMSALVLCFPPLDEDDKYYLLPFFWIPDYQLQERVRKDHVRYDEWKARGFLEATEGKVIDYHFIQKKINELNCKYRIREVAFDPWGGKLLAHDLDNDGIAVTGFGQGYKSMSPPAKEMLRLVYQERIAHGGNPVLRWHFDNMVVKIDEAGNIKPNKGKATEKIDGAVAAIMALSLATNPSRLSRGLTVVDIDD